MSRYFEKEIVCGCCGTSFTARLLAGFTQEGAMGLDTDPHTPAVFDRVSICPRCGYARFKVDTPAEAAVAQTVRSAQYQALFRDGDVDETYKKLALAAQVERAAGEMRNAGYVSLLASWRLRQLDRDPAPALEDAVDSYGPYLEDNEDVDAAVTFVDCMRQLGRMEDVRECVEELLQLGVDGLHGRILRYEAALAEQNDRAQHLVSEAGQ